MDIEDVTTFGQQLIKLGLLTEVQWREALEEAHREQDRAVPEMIHVKSVLERTGVLTNWQTAKALKGDTDGFFLGGYRVLYKISSGSFGRVFRADDPRNPGRVVAIKVLRRRWSEDRQRIDLFIREGRVGLTLKHPNIVEVMAINQDPASGHYYIIMEFVEGGNLREILEIRKTLTVAESLRICEDAAAGLAYAYSRGITHRDVKLTNLLISSTGEAKLVDFGLAQMFAAIGTEKEQVDRTVDYAGLEKATNVPHGDVRSDIFFLGCVFYEMLTGKAPLEMTRDRYARMNPRRFQEVKILRPGEIDAPPSVYALCETSLAFDPKRRYQTPSQQLDAVRAARRDIGAVGGAGKPVARSVFLVESDDHLQMALRDGLKEQGYRVLLASDPSIALDRFRQQPFDALIVDVETVGEEGLIVFDHLLDEAKHRGLKCAGIAILGQEEADWASRIAPRPNAAVLVRPVNFKVLRYRLRDLLKAV
jgi:serine/threonine protein kinase